MVATVTRLYCYPLKAAQGMAVHTLTTTGTGVRYDREWMVVDARGRTVAQRASKGLGVGIHQMCLIRAAIAGTELLLDAPEMPTLRLPLWETGAPRIVQVRIWGTEASGTDQGRDASAWISRFLGRYRPGRYRIVRANPKAVRLSVSSGRPMGYADTHPLLVCGQSSLDDLNRRIASQRLQCGEPPQDDLGWDRFRPNVVIGGLEPYAEDAANYLILGSTLICGEEPSKRCLATGIDQATAFLGPEPMRTLGTYRRLPVPGKSGVAFGRKFSQPAIGHLRVGDMVMRG